MRRSKRQLGLDYLFSAGALFSGVLIFQAIQAVEIDPLIAAGSFSGVISSGGLASSVYWLPKTNLNDDQIWTIAVFSGLGIGILSVIDIGLIYIHTMIRPILNWAAIVLISNIGVGGLLGILVGGMWELNKNSRSLYEKNSVLSRTLRHNIRNDIMVIRGSAEILEDELSRHTDLVESIQQKSDGILKMSIQARRLQKTLDPRRGPPEEIDLIPVIDELLLDYRKSAPETQIKTDLPSQAIVYADTQVDMVIENLIDNAILHGNGEVTIEVRHSGNPHSGNISIEVSDNGPGIPDSELTVLANGGETALEHSSGLGLWLVKWYAEEFNGSVSFETDASEGTTTIFRLPSP